MAVPKDMTDLLSRVRQESRNQHQQLESLLPFNEALTLERYRELLIGFWGLFDPLEKALEAADIPDELDVRARHRSPLLLQDLVAVGTSAERMASLPRCENIPALNTKAKALGCMYVLEGSRLGGQYVSKLIKERLGLTEHSGCAFFSSDGAEVSNIWRKFCEVAREQTVTPEQQEEFIAAAKCTFSTFIDWIGKQQDLYREHERVSMLSAGKL